MDPLSEKNIDIPSAQQPDIYSSENQVHVTPARSFSSDLANAIRDKGGSVVRIAIAEEEKHRREKEEVSATSKKNIIFIIATMIIVLAAIGILMWSVLHAKQSTQQIAPTSTPVPTSIINAENYQILDITGKSFTDTLAAITNAVQNTSVDAGTVNNIVITTGTTTRIPAGQFLTDIGSHAPGDLVQALSPQYMLGIYNYTKNNEFLIIQGTAHDYLLSGMLEWEPHLFNDMVPLFNIDTSSFTKAQLQSAPFTDMIIENRDTRAVVDAKGNPIFFYSFLDDDTIIFATDPKTLSAVVGRY